MRVKAKMMGYYNHQRRREGDVFDILDEKEFSENWMIAASKRPSVEEEVFVDEVEDDDLEEDVI